MTNHRLRNSDEHPTTAKRKRVLAAVSQELVTSEDDDNVADGMDICDIVGNHALQQRQTATSSALNALGETIRNTLMEINEIREQNRERRHRELLQILTKMVQQESPSIQVHVKPNVLNLNTESNEHINTNNFVVEDGQDAMSSSSLKAYVNNTNKTDLNDALKNQKNVEKMSAKYIKLLPKPQSTCSNSEQLDPTKNNFTHKKNNSKEELQNMRAQMLELQRQKMEDRERKKLEFLQIQNM